MHTFLVTVLPVLIFAMAMAYLATRKPRSTKALGLWFLARGAAMLTLAAFMPLFVATLNQHVKQYGAAQELQAMQPVIAQAIAQATRAADGHEQLATAKELTSALGVVGRRRELGCADEQAMRKLLNSSMDAHELVAGYARPMASPAAEQVRAQCELRQSYMSDAIPGYPNSGDLKTPFFGWSVRAARAYYELIASAIGQPALSAAERLELYGV